MYDQTANIGQRFHIHDFHAAQIHKKPERLMFDKQTYIINQYTIFLVDFKQMYVNY